MSFNLHADAWMHGHKEYTHGGERDAHAHMARKQTLTR